MSKKDSSKFVTPNHLTPEIQDAFEDLLTKCKSSFVSRDQIFEFTGGTVSKGYMANLDCLGEGPERFRMGRKIVYPVKPLVKWLIARSVSVGNRVKS